MENRLNTLLADMVVVSHKLQSYHCYLKGAHFFDDHAQLERYYDEMNENADAVAELMLQLHMSPASTMKGFLSLSGIEEAAGGEVSSAEAYSHVLADFEYLLDEVYAVKAAADEENQILVSNQMDDYIASLSKHNWMLRQVLK